MITIRKVENPVVVTDNLNVVNPTTTLYAGDTYTCVAAPVVVKSGIQYSRPLPTGVTTSYRTGDDYWQTLNNPYPDAPSEPLYCQGLVDFWTLKHLNADGNYDRFTDRSGAVALDANGRYTSDTATDNLTGLEWGINVEELGNNHTWEESIDSCHALSTAEGDDWYLPNIKELLSVCDFNFDRPLLVTFLLGGRQMTSSTTSVNSSTNLITINTLNQIRTGAKTLNLNHIPVRQRY